MPIDPETCDPAFRGRRSGEGVEELVEWARARLGVGPDRLWRLTGSRRKLAKTLFEVDENGKRIIGKVSHSERARETFHTLTLLWNAGMRPPSRWIVTEPIAWFPERNLLLQTKAEGMQLVELVRTRADRAFRAVEAAGQWLHALQSLPLKPREPVAPDVERCRIELIAELPDARDRIDRVAERLTDELKPHADLVPSHGDYHPFNVFVADDGTVTAIDLDTFAARERAVDVAYFLAQTAILGYHVLGGIGETAELRAAFQRSAPLAPPERIDAGIRWAFLRSLHYDLCILKLRERGHVEPFIAVAENGL